VRIVEDSAFAGCSSLEHIYLPPSVETVGKNCFSDCGKLNTVEFGVDSRLAEIRYNAFPEGIKVTGCPIKFVDVITACKIADLGKKISNFFKSTTF
jgi:hypothetical protein